MKTRGSAPNKWAKTVPTANHHIEVDGEQVTLIGIRHFLVKSKSGPGEHTVEYDDTEKGWACSCVGWNVRKDCRHSRAIQRWERGEADVKVASA
jgi:hypothetical protein